MVKKVKKVLKGSKVCTRIFEPYEPYELSELSQRLISHRRSVLPKNSEITLTQIVTRV